MISKELAIKLNMKLLLIENGFEVEATEDEIYNFVIQVSKGEINIEEIKKWITIHLKK